MNIDEVIDALSKIRAEHGNLPVVVYDGPDPSDLERIPANRRPLIDILILFYTLYRNE